MTPKINEIGFYILDITKNEVESFDHVNQLSFLSFVRENAKKFEGKINFMVSGYDDDKRELWEIKEVREYFDFLDRCFPYWFFFLDRQSSENVGPLGILTLLVVPVKSIIKSNEKGKVVDLDIYALEKFINIHFSYLNEITDELGMSEEENRRISSEVISLFHTMLGITLPPTT